MDLTVDDKGVIGGPDEVVDLSTRTIRGGTKEGQVVGLVPVFGALLRGILVGVLVTLHCRLVHPKIHGIVLVPFARHLPLVVLSPKIWCRWIGVADVATVDS